MLVTSLLAFIPYAGFADSLELENLAIPENLSDLNLNKNDPLYPYKASDFYLENLHKTNEIGNFITEYQYSPAAKSLYQKWLQYYFEIGQYSFIVKNYNPDIRDSEALRCIYKSSLYHLGQTKIALEDIELLWLSPRSVSHYCDDLFAAWGKSEDDNYLLKRALISYQAGNIRFATTLANKKPNTQWANDIIQFSQYINNPLTLLDHKATIANTKFKQALLPKALDKLIIIDSVKYTPFTLSFLNELRHNNQYQATLSKLLSYLVNRNSTLSMDVFNALETPNSSDYNAITRYLVMHDLWETIIQIVPETTDDEASLYWLATALEKIKGIEEAKPLYKKISKVRSYYGFLASDRLGAPYEYNNESININQKIQKGFNLNKNLQAALLFDKQKAYRKKYIEIMTFASNLTVENKAQLAHWLKTKGLYADAIVLLAKDKSWNQINTRFPAPYQKIIKAKAKETSVDETLIYAVMRQESSMNKDAKSSAKAEGLMQVLRTTARDIINKKQLLIDIDDMIVPENNILLGATYLSMMESEFKRIPLVLAAYNAGPARVLEWQNNFQYDLKVWIEAIPFNETRKYVQNILEFQQVYAHLLDIKIPKLSYYLE